VNRISTPVAASVDDECSTHMLVTFVLLPAALFSPPSWLQSLTQNLQQNLRSQPLAAATELRDALVRGETDAELLNPLVDECLAARVPFRGELLGDGELWRAASIVRGEIPRWERNAKLFPFLKNRAGQAYSLDGAGGGSVVNYGEVLGRSLYFRAEGTFKPTKSTRGSTNCPVDFNVAISSGGFVLGGMPINLPISGPGYLRCRYIDESIRIFESPKDSPDRWEEAGLIVCQVKDSLFDDPVAGQL
jgi:hypothetical protein